MTQTMNDLARREIRVWMVRRGMKNADLARATGLTPSQMQRRLDGSSDLTANDLDRISRALDISVSELFSARAAS